MKAIFMTFLLTEIGGCWRLLVVFPFEREVTIACAYKVIDFPFMFATRRASCRAALCAIVSNISTRSLTIRDTFLGKLFKIMIPYQVETSGVSSSSRLIKESYSCNLPHAKLNGFLYSNHRHTKVPSIHQRPHVGNSFPFPINSFLL